MLERLLKEASRRRVFRTSALYIVAAWVLLQIADVLFPAFDIPDTAKQPLVWAAVLGFPVAVIFGWLFDIGGNGIRRTLPAQAGEPGELPRLARGDYLILAALAGILIALILGATREVREVIVTPRIELSSPTAAAAPTARLENSIAVLPFANISSDAENEYFCDGISEEILNRLGTISGLNVIGRTSSFAFKGSDIALPELSALLGVRFLLQGSVRKADDALRISVQLLDESGLQLWQQSFDRPLANVFALQTEIADAVAARVAPQVTHLPAVAYEPLPLAYEHYLRGREFLHRRKVVAAREELRYATEIDPQFAEAHAELALSLLVGFSGTPKDLATIRQAIDRAQQLQPGLLRALAAEGLYLYTVAPNDPAAAERLLREVLAGDPNMVDALNWLYGILENQGRKEEAFAILKRAGRIDPLHPSVAGNLAIAYRLRNEPEQAKAILQTFLEQPEPNQLGNLYNLMSIYQDQGDLVGMHRLAEHTLLAGNFPGYDTQIFSYALLGDWERAQYFIRAIQDEFPESELLPYWLAVNSIWQGRFSDAYAEMRAALGEEMPENQDYIVRVEYGAAAAQAGDCPAGIAVLESLLGYTLEAGRLDYSPGELWPMHAWHALAQCHLQQGNPDRAQGILEIFEQDFIAATNLYERTFSQAWYVAARNALMQGNMELALTRLEQAAASGWRDYYLYAKDPHFEPLWQHPRYQRVMDEVKADVDRQRVEVQKLDAENDLLKLHQKLVSAKVTEAGNTVP